MTRHIEPPLARIREETESNHQVFVRLCAGFARHEGRYALMKSGLIIDFFASRQEAMLVGIERCLDRIFSIHRVRTKHHRPRWPARDAPPAHDLPADPEQLSG